MSQLVKVEFEGLGDAGTEQVVIASFGIAGYEHITGEAGALLGSITGNVEEVKKNMIDAVHNLNGGCWCEITNVPEKEVEHLL